MLSRFESSHYYIFTVFFPVIMASLLLSPQSLPPELHFGIKIIRLCCSSFCIFSDVSLPPFFLFCCYHVVCFL